MPVFASVLSTGTFALTIPIIIIFGGIAVAITAIIMSGRKKELLHKERLISIEKGIQLPAEPVKVEKPKYGGTRTAGLVIFLVGFALTIALFATEGSEGVWGLLPMAMGAGLLIGAHLEKQEYERRAGQRDLAG
jgi:hypothetical protein